MIKLAINNLTRFKQGIESFLACACIGVLLLVGSGSVPNLGSLARQNKNAVEITGGTITGATLNATDLASGTIPNARFPATLPALNGSALTNLNGTNIVSGTVAAERLPSVLQTWNGLAPSAYFQTLPTLSSDRAVKGALNNTTINVCDDEFGAIPDGESAADAAMTSASAVLICASGPFAADDVGKLVAVTRAGVTNGGFGRKPLFTTIASYQSATQVTLSATAQDTVTDQTVVWGTDNADALNAAVDAADAIDADVIIPKGVYCTSESIDATGATNISIRGMGRDVSVIRTLGVSVSVTIDGSSTAGGVLIGNGATNITVEDLWVDHRYLDVGANGIAVFGFTENVPTSTRIAIRRCKVTGVGELHRYNIFVQNCEYFEVTDNLIDGGTTTPNGVADENGIELFGAQYGTVANNTVINCNSAGILCFTQDEYSEWDNKDVVISGNLVQNANRGIAVVATFANANSNLTVANNIILDSVTYGIVGTSDNIGSPTISYLKIDGNTIDGALSATSDGILFTCGGEANVRGLSILGNTIRDVRGTEANGTGGILLFSAGNCDIIGNQIFPMTKASTAWVTSTAYAVGDYVLSSSQVYRCLIAHTSGTFATDLSNGNWTVNDTYGIRLNGGANINVLGNTIQYSPKIPVYLDTIANCTVADNTFKDWTSASAGIHSPAGCSDIHVHNNFFAKASTNGYATFMAGVAGLSITDNRVDTGAALFATPSTFYIHNNCTGTVINHGNQGFLQLFTSVGTGTAYTVTATAAAVDMGTTDPLCTIAYGAKYKLKAKFTLSFNTAAFDGNRTITMKLRRTNNTAADIAGSTRTLATGTRTLEGFVEFVTPEVIYSTVNSTANSTADTIAPYIDVSALPATGTATVVGCEVIWEPLPY